MSQRASRQATARAEARRRARIAARGDEDGPISDADAEADSVTPARQSFLQRILPAAPPLPGKGDPLEGFNYNGRFRSVAEAGYLLSRHPVAWLLPGLLYVAIYELALWSSDRLVSSIVQVIQYGALVAAGWIGWQRPWLFGAAAGLIAALATTSLVLYLSSRAPSAANLSAPGYIAAEALFFVALGALAGRYGGYLRRRMAAQRPTATAQANRRRR
jgi:hypothetical protein